MLRHHGLHGYILVCPSAPLNPTKSCVRLGVLLLRDRVKVPPARRGRGASRGKSRTERMGSCLTTATT
jgi:hypothetical protein